MFILPVIELHVIGNAGLSVWFPAMAREEAHAKAGLAPCAPGTTVRMRKPV